MVPKVLSASQVEAELLESRAIKATWVQLAKKVIVVFLVSTDSAAPLACLASQVRQARVVFPASWDQRVTKETLVRVAQKVPKATSEIQVLEALKARQASLVKLDAPVPQDNQAHGVSLA